MVKSVSNNGNPGNDHRSISLAVAVPTPAPAPSAEESSKTQFRTMPTADKLDSIAKAAITTLPTIREQDEAHAIVDMLELATSTPEGSEVAARNGPGVVGALGTQLHKHLVSMNHSIGRTLNLEERRIAALSFIGKVADNKFESALGRWASNVANVSVRTGLSTWAITALRQQMGTGIEHLLINSELHPTGVAGLANSALLVGPVLNIVGAVLDEKNQVATAQSRAGRGAMLGLSLGSAVAVANLSSETRFAASALSITAYALSRDLFNSQVKLSNNAGGIKMCPTAKAALVYGGAQFLAGEAMDFYAASSGVGAVKAAGLPYPNTFANDLTRGFINGVVEVTDDVLSPHFSRQAQVALNKQQIPADRLTREDTEDLKIRLKCGFADRSAREHCLAMRDQFLTTSAMRVSAFEAVNAMVFALDLLIGDSLDAEAKGQLMNGFVAISIACIYPAFAGAHYKRSPPVATPGVAMDRAPRSA